TECLRNRREVVVGIVDEEVLGKIAVTLRGVFITTEHSATLRGVATLTVFTMTARRNCADGDPVTFFTASDILAELIHHANTFMSEAAPTGDFNDTAHGVYVRSTNQRCGGFDDGIVRAGVRDRLFHNPDFTYRKKYQRFHDAPPVLRRLQPRRPIVLLNTNGVINKPRTLRDMGKRFHDRRIKTEFVN